MLILEREIEICQFFFYISHLFLSFSHILLYMWSLPTNFSSSLPKQFIRWLLTIVGIFCIWFGLLRSGDSGTSHTLYILDNSLSMEVQDISTASGQMLSRLDLAKKVIRSHPHTGERALMTSALGAELILPMTRDPQVWDDTITSIRSVNYGGGSIAMTPLETARLIYGDVPDIHIVWLSDGEFSDSWVTLSGWTTPPDITIIGLGTPVGWPILTGYDADGHPRYKESWGQQVISHRDDERLHVISETIWADQILLDRDDLSIVSDIAKNRISHTILPYVVLVGVLLICIGMMVPRFHYFSPWR